jgi:hypothetical protein
LPSYQLGKQLVIKLLCSSFPFNPGAEKVIKENQWVEESDKNLVDPQIRPEAFLANPPSEKT